MHEPGVGVAGDEAHADESALAQRARESEPAGVGLRADGRDAGHAARAVGPDADGRGDRCGPHAAVLPALEVGGVEEQVGRLDATRPTRCELADLGVQ